MASIQEYVYDPLSCTIGNEETFLQDFLAIMKRTLENIESTFTPYYTYCEIRSIFKSITTS